MAASTPQSLVLLSGLLCDDFVWKEISSLLADEIEIQIFSFAGFSSFKTMATHVLDNSPECFALAGHSMGGRVALQIMDMAPERVTHLGLLNTGVHPKKEDEEIGRQRLLDIADQQGMAAVANEWLPPMMGTQGKANSALMQALKDMIIRHSPEDFHGQIHALLNRPNAQLVLDSINVPTMLLSADEDKWSPIAQHVDMQRYLKRSHLVELTGAGHMSICEAPEKVAECFKKLVADKL
jgi:pimeloyl-ACP methyl ester carboxylesterase